MERNEEEKPLTRRPLSVFLGSGEPVVRSRRDVVADLLLVLLGITALAVPAWITRLVDKTAAGMAGGVLAGIHGAPDVRDATDPERELWVLREDNRRLKESLQGMENFRTLAGRLSLSKDEYVPALIIGARREAGRWRYLLDSGSSAGVEPGMGVILGYAAFGVVENVTENRAWMLRLDAPPTKVPAITARSRAEGLMEAMADRLSLSYVRQKSGGEEPEVAVDDFVLTSGRAGVFPPGVVIGRVIGVGRSEDALFHVVDIEPELEHLTGEVVVVWSSERSERRLRSGP